MEPTQNDNSPQRPSPRAWRIATMSARYVVGFLICASIAHAASNSIIWESGDQIVQLAGQDDDSAPPNDHPITTTANEIAAMLEMLRVRYADEEPDVTTVAVFTRDEIDNLGKAIASGLGRAAASQDVIFHVIGSQRVSGGWFARRNRVSAGRIFYRDGELNIIFGQVQTPYRKKNVYGRTDEDFYPRNYGSRASATKHEVAFLTNNATRLHQGGAGERQDWIVIDPVAVVAGGSHVDKADSRTAQTAAAPPVVPAETPAMPPAANSSDPPIEQHPGTYAQPVPPVADVEQRLEALKRLRDRELISEEAYQSKMKEILQDL